MGYNFYPWKKNTVHILPVEKQNTREKNQIFARENEFTACEKTKKNALEKSGREKVEKWAKKWAWKQQSAREKIEKKAKNRFHGHFSFSRVKKKTLAWATPISYVQKMKTHSFKL